MRIIRRPGPVPAALIALAIAVATSCTSTEPAQEAAPVTEPASPPATDRPPIGDAAPPRPVGSLTVGPADLPACAPAAPDGPVLVTASCSDPALATPYLDADEERTTTDERTGVTVTYRYVHGGFEGTNARFSFAFPLADDYRGRFFQSTYPTISTEEPDAATLGFAISNGAYVVATNNNGGMPTGGALAGYRVNAASAVVSRSVAAQVYGTDARPRGYLYGASGGAYQTLGGMENTDGVWDGGVPMVSGTPNSIPSNMTAQLLALRVLRDRFAGIVDATEPGGSGDPFAGLDDEEHAVLEEVTRLGHPLDGWWNHEHMQGGAFVAVAGGVRTLDPTYVDDFWSQPGYEGADPASSVRTARVQHDTTVVGVVGDPATSVELADVPASDDLLLADLVVTGGAAAGTTLTITAVDGTTLTVGGTAVLAPGDQVRVDNSWLLALQHYHRHQVPTADQYGWDHLRGADGTPRHPQRTQLVGPIFAKAAGGAVTTGRFHGKMIMLASAQDVEAFPWPADWYRRQAEAALGPDLDDRYRLWFMEHAGHTPPRAASEETHLVRYEGELEQALLRLDEWVSDGTPPPATTGYEIDANTQLVLDPSADARHGVQPLVRLAVGRPGAHDGDGDVRAEVAAGDEVELTVDALVPAGAGEIVRVEWDLEGQGTFVEGDPVEPGATVHASVRHRFDGTGTTFPVVRVTSARSGDPNAPYGLVQNLARARVVAG